MHTIHAIPPEPLAANQFRDTAGRVHTLRWHSGEPQGSVDGGEWKTWRVFGDRINPGLESRVVDWFRAHCPIDRFITDDGKLLRFEMQEDGSAEIAGGEYSPADCDGYSDRLPEYARALYRFRDHERARWSFRNMHEHLFVSHDSQPGGWYVDGAWHGNQDAPAWVRAKARRIWEALQS